MNTHTSISLTTRAHLIGQQQKAAGALRAHLRVDARVAVANAGAAHGARDIVPGTCVARKKKDFLE